MNKYQTEIIKQHNLFIKTGPDIATIFIPKMPAIENRHTTLKLSEAGNTVKNVPVLLLPNGY